MQLTKIEKNGITCAIVNGSEPVIIDAQTALDVLMSAKYDIGTKNHRNADFVFIKTYKGGFSLCQ